MRLDNKTKGFCLTTTTEIRTLKLESKTTDCIITAIAGREYIEATFKTPNIRDTYVPQFKTITEGRVRQYAACYINVNKILEANRLAYNDVLLQKSNYLKKQHILVTHHQNTISIKTFVDNTSKCVDIDLKDKITIRIKISKSVRGSEIILEEHRLVYNTKSTPKTTPARTLITRLKSNQHIKTGESS